MGRGALAPGQRGRVELYGSSIVGDTDSSVSVLTTPQGSEASGSLWHPLSRSIFCLSPHSRTRSDPPSERYRESTLRSNLCAHKDNSHKSGTILLVLVLHELAHGLLQFRQHISQAVQLGLLLRVEGVALRSPLLQRLDISELLIEGAHAPLRIGRARPFAQRRLSMTSLLCDFDLAAFLFVRRFRRGRDRRGLSLLRELLAGLAGHGARTARARMRSSVKPKALCR
mmetsp:Transcript_8931/g.28720  ORF Transcript_8931/g.28720 Transcript_8931/m.28720 type:complete len:227 (-) Transcript_8931:68-748(-)